MRCYRANVPTNALRLLCSVQTIFRSLPRYSSVIATAGIAWVVAGRGGEEGFSFSPRWVFLPVAPGSPLPKTPPRGAAPAQGLRTTSPHKGAPTPHTTLLGDR